MARRGSRTRIVVVEDHEVVRRGIITLIGEEGDLEVVAEASEATEAKKALSENDAELAIVDLELPGKSGLQLIEEIRSQYPDLKILVLSAYEETLYAERALEAGANGYVMKKAATREVIDAVRQVVGGRVYVSSEMSERLLRRLVGGGKEATGIEGLTDRELQVFRLIGRGRSPSGIADELHISVKTVESHREHIKDKLGAKNARELLQRATLWVHNQGEADK